MHACEPTAVGGESPEEAGGKAVCSNVGQADIVETSVEAGCSCWLVNANLYSRKGQGGERRAIKASTAASKGIDSYAKWTQPHTM